jgi:hypothetical protein
MALWCDSTDKLLLRSMLKHTCGTLTLSGRSLEHWIYRKVGHHRKPAHVLTGAFTFTRQAMCSQVLFQVDSEVQIAMRFRSEVYLQRLVLREASLCCRVARCTSKTGPVRGDQFTRQGTLTYVCAGIRLLDISRTSGIVQWCLKYILHKHDTGWVLWFYRAQHRRTVYVRPASSLWQTAWVTGVRKPCFMAVCKPLPGIALLRKSQIDIVHV